MTWSAHAQRTCDNHRELGVRERRVLTSRFTSSYASGKGSPASSRLRWDEPARLAPERIVCLNFDQLALSVSCGRYAIEKRGSKRTVSAETGPEGGKLGSEGHDALRAAGLSQCDALRMLEWAQRWRGRRREAACEMLPAPTSQVGEMDC